MLLLSFSQEECWFIVSVSFEFVFILLKHAAEKQTHTRARAHARTRDTRVIELLGVLVGRAASFMTLKVKTQIAC